MNKAGLLASTFAAAALYGCVDQPDEASTAGISFEEYKATALREPGTGGYVVDWDIVLPDEAALYDYWKQYQQGGLTIYAINGADIKWTPAQVKNLRYCIGNSFGANKQLIVAAMQGATVQGWEKLANIKFIYDATQDATCTAANNNVVFDVNLAPAGSQYLARAFFPNDTRANRNVLVEAASFNPNQTGGISLTNILIHELGHTLGFRHEHIRRPNQVANCIEDDPNNLQYRGLTAYDQVSTMHYPQCGSPGNTLALSALDRTGAVAVYGPPVVNTSPMTSITSPASGATVQSTFMVTAAVDDTDLVRAELYIDGSLSQTKTAGPFTFEVTGLSVGQHQLEIRGTDAANQTAVSSITVTVASGGGGDGTGGGTGTGGGDGKGDGSEVDVTGGCSTGGGAGLLLGLGLLGLVRRRRR
jgi:hypothetical protein